MAKKHYRMGLDIGSTTIKLVITDESDNLVYHRYKRHLSDMRNTLISVINEAYEDFADSFVTISVTGSGGISVAQWLGVNFVQEVIASTECIKRYIPETDVAIELGGEDAKLTFFGSGIDQRMNETCAGGTGAFIDQMAAVLQTDAAGLNEMAKRYNTIYPIAARCGVFAKTDVLPLLNEGSAKEDIAVSIFQAVVDQTIGGLACGRTIRGNVAFLGGPLFFLSELRRRFVETLELAENEIIFPENPQLFVAMGAALLSKNETPMAFKELCDKLAELQKNKMKSEIPPLPRLFNSERDYEDFKNRHSREGVLKNKNMSEAEGDLFLGLDVGSTTTKAILIDKDDNLIFSSYESNLGNPVQSVILVLRKIYAGLPDKARISRSCITGYGEGLIKAALGIDDGEVETVAHFTAARYFVPDVSFILDIGGQDMKCMYVKKGAIDKIVLNEACSSGCGSFIETFAKSVGASVQDFAKAAILSEHPVDLGSRCTVFMNSKVKQAQKEGMGVGDISAGLSYSVVRNALYKVIKVSGAEDLGAHVVVQGGAFFNDAVLRAFELSVGTRVTRFAISGLMGAFGSALIAKDKFEKGRVSTIISNEGLDSFTIESTNRRCKACSNHCLLTVNKFSDKRRYITGNRCEKGLQEVSEVKGLPNIHAYRNSRLFDYYIPLEEENAPMGTIGIPRVLNIYENFPYWFTFFTSLGFRVLISDKSSKELFNTGLDTMPSQTVCYPAKLVHGHIANLISRGIKRIFYPCIQMEVKEPGTDNSYNCPVVCSYPELIRLNVDAIKNENVDFISPFLPLNEPKSMEASLVNLMKPFGIEEYDVRIAVRKAERELGNFKNDIRQKGEETIKYLEETGGTGVVLSGRPYHGDTEINHGIPELIVSNGLAVLTEDSIAHLGQVERPLKAVDQWTYHGRLYKAASFVAEHENLELIQLNSFGCGLDAVTTEQVYDILERHEKLHTVIKIDEGGNLGAVRIRIRSLIAAIQDRRKRGVKREFTPAKRKAEFTKAMKDTHTIIAPQLSPIHMHMMKEAFTAEGYKFKVLEKAERSDVEKGLKFINNDACFPAIMAVGQLLNYVMSPNCDTERVAVIISQTAGGCRATNYIGWLKHALERSGLGHIPVLSFNLHGLEEHEGFKINMRIVKRLVMALLYGDLLMRMLHRIRPYEKVQGQTEMVYNKWADVCARNVYDYNWKQFKRDAEGIVKEFDSIPIRESEQRPKVGIVGEILIKFQPDANNRAVEVIESEGGEAVVPDFMDFVLYCAFDDIYRSNNMAGSKIRKFGAKILIWYIERKRDILRKILSKSKRFEPMPHIYDLAKMAQEVVSLGNQSGEGWLLTAEMLELIEGGVSNILCVQPFACLPNHITGKGVMKTLRSLYDNVNIAAVDYDAGASEVNQLNRIKLLMSVANKNLASA